MIFFLFHLSMLHYHCNTTCYHLCTVLLHSLGSQNIILFTTLLYIIYSVNFTIFTYTVLLLYRISLYILSLITILFLSYISIFCTFLLQCIPYTHDHCPIYHFFFLLQIVEINSFNIFAKHFPVLCYKL